MARTLLVSTTNPTAETVAPAGNSLDVVEAAADAALGNYFVWNGKQTIYARNSTGGAETITVQADADTYGRDGAITDYSIGAGEIAQIPVREPIWKQTSDNDRVYVDASDVGILISVISDSRL